MRYRLVLLFVVFFTGCAASKSFEPTKPFDKLVILNQSDQIIKETTIYSKSNNRKIQCGQLVSQAHCAYKFHRKKNAKNSFRIQWHIGNKTYVYDNLSISNVNLNENKPVSISINILNDGKFSIKKL